MILRYCNLTMSNITDGTNHLSKNVCLWNGKRMSINSAQKTYFRHSSKFQLCIFFGFDVLPNLWIVNSTPLLILHRRSDSICIRHKSTSPILHIFMPRRCTFCGQNIYKKNKVDGNKIPVIDGKLALSLVEKDIKSPRSCGGSLEYYRLSWKGPHFVRHGISLWSSLLHGRYWYGRSSSVQRKTVRAFEWILQKRTRDFTRSDLFLFQLWKNAALIICLWHLRLVNDGRGIVWNTVKIGEILVADGSKFG